MGDTEWAGLSDDFEAGEPEYLGMVDEGDLDFDEEEIEMDADLGADAGMVEAPEPEEERQPMHVMRMPGAYITMNSDALAEAARNPTKNVDRRPVRKIGPNIYAVMTPTASRRRGGMGMAGKGVTVSAGAGMDWGGLISGIGQTATGITGTVLGHQQAMAESQAAREAQRLAAQAASEERQQQFTLQQQQFRAQQEQAKRQFEAQMAEMRAQREAMMRQGASAAQAAAAIPPPVAPPILSAAPPGGMPTWGWALIGLGGAAMLGTVLFSALKK